MKPCTVLTLSLCGLLALLGSPASAEILYDREGIQVQGTARIVSRNAATCNVLEEKYSPEEYQKMKANQAAPPRLAVGYLRPQPHRQTPRFPLSHLQHRIPLAALHQLERGGPRRRSLGGLRRCRRPAPARLVGRRLEGPLHALWHARRPGRARHRVPGGLSRRPAGLQELVGRLHLCPAAVSGAASSGCAREARGPPPGSGSSSPPDILADKYLRQAGQLVGDKDYPGARQALEKLRGPAAGARHRARARGPFPLRPGLVGGRSAGAGHGGGGALAADPGPGGRALRPGSGPDQPRRRRAGPGRVQRRRACRSPDRVVRDPGGGDGGLRRNRVRGDSPGRIPDGFYQPACV